MSLKIRLQRHGAKHSPHYRMVVADSRFPRDGRFVEILGTYVPKSEQLRDRINLKIERIDHWIGVGALPSDTARSLIKIAKKEAHSETKGERISLKRSKSTGTTGKPPIEAVETSRPASAQEMAAVKPTEVLNDNSSESPNEPVKEPSSDSASVTPTDSSSTQTAEVKTSEPVEKKAKTAKKTTTKKAKTAKKATTKKKNPSKK